MDVGWFGAVLGFALAMAGTPGPNNTLVTTSGANYGFRRTLPLMAGITLGVVAIMLAVGAVGSPLVRHPVVEPVVRWVGLAYLLWLAWRIATAQPEVPGAGAALRRSRPMTFLQGALFQFVNPKLWALVAGAVATYGSTAGTASPIAVAAAFGLVLGIATAASTVAWTLVGVGVGRVIRTERHMRLFNWLMAAVLLASLVPAIVEGLRGG